MTDDEKSALTSWLIGRNYVLGCVVRLHPDMTETIYKYCVKHSITSEEAFNEFMNDVIRCGLLSLKTLVK